MCTHEHVADATHNTMHTDAVPFDPVDAVLSDSDMLFHVFCQLTNVAFLRPVLSTSKTLRAAALRADLPLWWSCNEESFRALERPKAAESLLPRLISRITNFSSSPEDSRSMRWHCDSVLALLRAKWRLTSLDLSGCKLPSQEVFAAVLEALPSSLTSLSISHDCNQPDAALATLRNCKHHLNALPRLTTLDLRGILTERSLAGLRILGRLGRADPNVGPSLALPLPALQRLAVGFHLFTTFGQHFGAIFWRYCGRGDQ